MGNVTLRVPNHIHRVTLHGRSVDAHATIALQPSPDGRYAYLAIAGGAAVAGTEPTAQAALDEAMCEIETRLGLPA